jgi:hypothetical protein
LKENVTVPVYKNENTAVGIRHGEYATPLYPQKLAIVTVLVFFIICLKLQQNYHHKMGMVVAE